MKESNQKMKLEKAQDLKKKIGRDQEDHILLMEAEDQTQGTLGLILMTQEKIRDQEESTLIPETEEDRERDTQAEKEAPPLPLQATQVKTRIKVNPSRPQSRHQIHPIFPDISILPLPTQFSRITTISIFKRRFDQLSNQLSRILRA